MNLALPHKFIVIAACAAASLLLLAPAAQADDSTGVAACVVTGAAGTTDAGGVDSVVTDLGTAGSWEPTELLDTDSGTFTFDSGTVACGAADIAGESPGLAAGADYTIDAAGNYVNLICGTGIAQGTATLGSNSNATNLATRFSIHFVGGVGALAISEVTGTATLNVAPLGTADQTVETGNGYGVIDILPTSSTGNVGCVDGNVTGFTVNGAFVTFLTGDAP